MHRFFYTSELLAATLDFIDSPCTGLSFAITCRALCEPGLAAAWRLSGTGWDLGMSISDKHRFMEVHNLGYPSIKVRSSVVLVLYQRVDWLDFEHYQCQHR